MERGRKHASGSRRNACIEFGYVHALNKDTLRRFVLLFAVLFVDSQNSDYSDNLYLTDMV